MSQTVNDQLVLISGESAAGKSASLRNIRDQNRWVYLNTEAGKRLPFKNNFYTVNITDPYQVPQAFEELRDNSSFGNKFDGVIIDSITFLMDMLESQYVLPSSDTQKAWGEYGQFFKRLLQQYIAEARQAVIVTGHTKSEYDEKAMRYRTQLAIKGAVGKGNGAEAYFSTVVGAKTMELPDLENYKNDMLHVSEEDELLGYKHVFQTKLTKATVGERLRSPMGMFSKEETFIDNDAQLLLDHLSDYYGLGSSSAV